MDKIQTIVNNLIDDQSQYVKWLSSNALDTPEYQKLLEMLKKEQEQLDKYKKAFETTNDESLSKMKRLLREQIKLLEFYKSPEVTPMERLDTVNGCIRTSSEIESLCNGDMESEVTKSFDKTIFLNNIEWLLEKTHTRKGDLEKDAGCQPGYISRIEKPDNTTPPPLELIITAAKKFDISIDLLLTVELSALSPTERYIVKLLDKLYHDTLDCKLDWRKEQAAILNNLEPDRDGCIYHPLFEYRSFIEKDENEYPQEISRVAFNSNYFGFTSYIAGDCYELSMKNKSTLYLMDVMKSYAKTGDKEAFAKEIWINTSTSGASFLTGSKDIPAVSNLVNNLFKAVAENMQHPKIKIDLKEVFDAYITEDDLGEHDPDPDIPF